MTTVTKRQFKLSIDLDRETATPADVAALLRTVADQLDTGGVWSYWKFFGGNWDGQTRSSVRGFDCGRHGFWHLSDPPARFADLADPSLPTSRKGDRP